MRQKKEINKNTGFKGSFISGLVLVILFVLILTGILTSITVGVIRKIEKDSEDLTLKPEIEIRMDTVYLTIRDTIYFSQQKKIQKEDTPDIKTQEIQKNLQEGIDTTQ
jgi:hypothetical protein